MAYNFDNDDMVKVHAHMGDDAAAPTFDEVAEHWSRGRSHKTVAEFIERARAAAIAARPKGFRLRGDWINDQGIIDNCNRPLSMRVTRGRDGLWRWEDHRGDLVEVRAFALGSDAPLLIEVGSMDPGVEVDADVMAMGGFSPDNGELARVGMPVVQI